MKICLAQCDVIDGDLEGNAKKLIAAAHEGARLGAALCMAPLEAVCGPCYAPLCPGSENYIKILEYMARELPEGLALLCGAPLSEPAAVLLQSGLVVGVPDNFYMSGRSFALCHALNADVAHEDIFIEPESSPYAPGRQAEREKNLTRLANRKKVWLLAPNLCGGYGQAVYNGQSLAISPSGMIYGRGKAFAPDLLMIDLDNPAACVAPAPNEDEAQWRALVTGTRDFCHKAGVEKAIIGLSGGLDSAVVACIAADALGAENILGVLMPSPYTSAESVRDAQSLAANLGMKTITLPINDLMACFSQSLQGAFAEMPAKPGDLTLENLQARIRGALLMALSNRGGALVLNTGNRSETAMGYCTLYGDTVGALAVIGDIFKTRVYELARWRNSLGKAAIPQNIIDRPPSAELRPNQKDTDSLPPYSELDPVLADIFTCRETGLAEKNSGIVQKILANEFKRRQCPPPLLVGGWH